MNADPARAERDIERRIDAETVLSALATVVLVVDGQDAIVYANQAAEQFLSASAAALEGRPLGQMVPGDSPLFALIEQAREEAVVLSEFGVTLESPRIGRNLVNVQMVQLPDRPGHVVVSIHQRSLADKIARQLTHRGAARSVTALGAMLAHEVKNPLSGIRGAAQLLEQGVAEEDRALTRLICDESDRICALVDRMGIFSDAQPIDRAPVNIHQVLEYARSVAQQGFARSIRFVEAYDPSLPPVDGNRDMLVQVFLNLIKNAAEAVPAGEGEIVLSTSYRHGVRLAVPGSDTRVHLPLEVSVQDNGAGIPDDLRPYLFDPFVSSKAKGSGLGLALVAKIIDDHGGVIEYDSRPRRTVFRVMLPVHAQEGESP